MTTSRDGSYVTTLKPKDRVVIECVRRCRVHVDAGGCGKVRIKKWGRTDIDKPDPSTDTSR